MFEGEIARGMAALDQHAPGWRAKVPADAHLDMRFVTKNNRICKVRS